MRQSLRRQHPGANDGEIERLILDWLQNRPFASPDDPVFRPVRIFE